MSDYNTFSGYSAPQGQTGMQETEVRRTSILPKEGFLEKERSGDSKTYLSLEQTFKSSIIIVWWGLFWEMKWASACGTSFVQAAAMGAKWGSENKQKRSS